MGLIGNVSTSQNKNTGSTCVELVPWLGNWAAVVSGTTCCAVLAAATNPAAAALGPTPADQGWGPIVAQARTQGSSKGQHTQLPLAHPEISNRPHGELGVQDLHRGYDQRWCEA